MFGHANCDGGIDWMKHCTTTEVEGTMDTQLRHCGGKSKPQTWTTSVKTECVV